MAFSAPASGKTSSATSSVSGSLFSRAAWANAALGGVDPRVFALALEAAEAAVDRGQAHEPATLTVIDYSKPSTQKRMWVYDLRTHALLFDELVSHGRGSGRTMSTSFSNAPESNKTSLGLFRTAESYVGKNGVHGAPYVNAATAKANGYLGRSLGCPAVRPEIARSLIDAIKGGGLVFAYYPDQA